MNFSSSLMGQVAASLPTDEALSTEPDGGGPMEMDREEHGKSAMPEWRVLLPPLPQPDLQSATEFPPQIGPRIRKVPSRYPRTIRDELPIPPPPVPPPTQSHSVIRRVILHVRDTIRTGFNSFGLLREYPHRPSYDPEAFVPVENLASYSQPAGPTLGQSKSSAPHQLPWPFKNMSIYRLMEWMNTGSNQKSEGELNRLVTEVICAADFKPNDLHGFNAHTENNRFDQSERADSGNSPFSADSWVEKSVNIDVPMGAKDASGVGKLFAVSGLHIRSLTAIITAAFTEEISRQFHLTPFRRFWKPSPSHDEERVYDEVYTSDAFLEAHDTLQKQPSEPGCTLEKVVIGLMFWSDSTHLANFGTAKVWPLYLYFANLSKYVRANPSSGACHHVAYIPSVSVLWFWYRSS
jgi:hypothetical protein